MMPPPSEAFGADQDRQQVEEKARSGERGQPEIEGHRFTSSIVAKPSVGERRRHQPGHHGYPEQILHRRRSSKSGGGKDGDRGHRCDIGSVGRRKF
jgi:hypothetical protein